LAPSLPPLASSLSLWRPPRRRSGAPPPSPPPRSQRAGEDRAGEEPRWSRRSARQGRLVRAGGKGHLAARGAPWTCASRHAHPGRQGGRLRGASARRLREAPPRGRGNVVFIRGEERLSADRVEMDDSGRGFFENAVGYVEPGVFIEGAASSVWTPTPTAWKWQVHILRPAQPRWGFTSRAPHRGGR